MRPEPNESSPPAPETPTGQPRPAWRSRLLGGLWAAFFRLQLATWRVRSDGLDDLDRRLARGEGAIIVFWHGKYLPLFGLLRDRQACVFTSLSARGEVIAELCRRFGHRAIHIPDRGRERSLEIMRRALIRERATAIAVDGPLGPYHAVKRGAIQLASELGWGLIPVSVAARNAWVAEKRWDRMELPRPFTRVHLAVGQPMTIPASLSEQDLEDCKLQVREALELLDESAQAAVKSAASE